MVTDNFNIKRAEDIGASALAIPDTPPPAAAPGCKIDGRN
jgi:hypothetical protein